MNDAILVWDALKSKISSLVKSLTGNCLRCERYDVTTAPDGSVIGVTQPFGNTELFIPYSQEVADAAEGDTVLVVWRGTMSTAKAYYFGNGYEGSSGGGGGGGGTSDHRQLTNRGANDQHPISAITGLQATLGNKADKSEIPSIEGLATEEEVEAVSDRVTDIEEIIPEQASVSNNLADKNFVNSSVQTATANFRGSWNTWAAVPTDASLYPVDYAGIRTPSTNDYMVVVDASEYTEATIEGTWRFKYGGIWATDGKDGWNPEYQVNETPLTAAQLAALNSGITAQSVAQIAGKENIGKITIGGTEKTATSHTVTIVTNGVTTTMTLVGVS